MSERDDGWIEMRFEDEFEVRERNEAEQRAATDPSFDYYTAKPPNQPKADIGQYVADQGFRVPLITTQSEWEQAFDQGNAMLRSEMPQDYDGLSGLLSSKRLEMPHQDQVSKFDYELGSLVMRGLRSGELDPTEYMTHLDEDYFCWSSRQIDLLEAAINFGVKIDVDKYRVKASRWRYIEGSNVSVFADPNVEGRYHFGVLQAKQHPTEYQSIGSYQVEHDEYDTEKQFRKHRQPFVARPYIEFYEEIRSLSRFDTRQQPVIEMQQDINGNLHFLQYLKTGQKQEFTEPFDMPSSDNTFITANVRGVTPPEGKDMRLFMEPSFLTKGMEGQGIFCSISRPHGLEVQLASRAAAFILHEAYISFQNNHFNASPLFRPPLAAGMGECYGTPESLLKRIDELIGKTKYAIPRGHRREAVPYLDLKVTSNGHEAAIESDWEVKTVAYDDIK